MADIQKHFERFHDIIRIDYEMSQPLREKRDIILDRIRKHLKDNGRPGFDEFLQGSYAMKTGVVPIEELEYDIDVGLRFSFSEKKHTAADIQYLRPTQTWNSKPNDLLAVQNLATVLSLLPGRIVVKKPTPEYDDLFARLSDGDMSDFKARLVALALDLGSAGRETDPVKACKLAKKHFGRDFPVPEPEETAKKTAAPAIVTSSSSASR